MTARRRAVNVLLVEDNPGDVLLAEEALAQAHVGTAVSVVGDGRSALAFMRGEGEHAARVRPDLVLLDLNLPDMGGQEVLDELKRDPALRSTPVLILTSSSNDDDIRGAYQSHANTYITKPDQFGGYTAVARCIDEYWLGIAELPVGSS